MVWHLEGFATCLTGTQEERGLYAQCHARGMRWGAHAVRHIRPSPDVRVHIPHLCQAGRAGENKAAQGCNAVVCLQPLVRPTMWTARKTHGHAQPVEAVALSPEGASAALFTATALQLGSERAVMSTVACAVPVRLTVARHVIYYSCEQRRESSETLYYDLPFSKLPFNSG